MIWLTWKLVTLPIRLTLGVLRLAWGTVRMFGVSRLLAFGVGIGTGLLVAPGPGRELRERLADALAERSAGVDVGAQVRHELAHSPRTWHLPQPTVTVDGGRVILTGEAPHETGRADLARVAAQVDGVVSVDNQIAVTA